ncbi:hypothetical protein [Facklamia sp. P12955]|uniref:hypothetical protein n=1 Tax=Facklamia sp. P12955 TaxID=3421946 RepID=UPI003D166DC9
MKEEALDVRNFYKMIEVANEKFDGHFTLMKFTSNWGVCYGTVNSREDISNMAKGDTVNEAIENLLKDPKSVYDL